MKSRFAPICLLIVAALFSEAKLTRAETKPLLGAQIWIEPGQTPTEIDGWFRNLASSNMPVARIFLMWSYLEPSPEHWDFTLYDEAFQAAEKYHVHIVATLTPNGPPPFLGGDGNQGIGILPTGKSRAAASKYIAKVVEHYRSSTALDTWLLVNEPGQPPTLTPVATHSFRNWLAQRYLSIDKLNAEWGTAYVSFDGVMPPNSARSWNHTPELDWRTFWESYQTTQLRWLADQVRKSDNKHPLHLNPAGILSNLAGVSDDLPSWRGFLDTLGCSIHPAWHFGLLDRDQYALGVSYLNDLVRGSIEPKPYWVTELQGGNNIYSGTKPMEPNARDISQWVWTSVGAGADRVIFWLLNARKEGVETAEWSMLNFEQQPSTRFTTAAEIAKILKNHDDFFSGAQPVRSRITILLSLDTMTFEETFHREDDPARSSNAHILEALGFYEALSRLAPPPRIKYFKDFDWNRQTAEPQVAILPDARELSEDQIHSLKDFVEQGNTLLITGLTGFYGPHAKAWPFAGFPLAEVTGGKLKEVHLTGVSPLISLHNPSAVLPSRLWVSSIALKSAKAIGYENGEVIATERRLPGGGRVIWIPSPIGLGAWLTDAQPLARYLKEALSTAVNAAPFTFAQPVNGCLLRTLEKDRAYVTIVTNGTNTSKQCILKVPSHMHATALWGSAPKSNGTEAIFDLAHRDTSVLLWQ